MCWKNCSTCSLYVIESWKADRENNIYLVYKKMQLLYNAKSKLAWRQGCCLCRQQVSSLDLELQRESVFVRAQTHVFEQGFCRHKWQLVQTSSSLWKHLSGISAIHKQREREISAVRMCIWQASRTLHFPKAKTIQLQKFPARKYPENKHSSCKQTHARNEIPEGI